MDSLAFVLVTDLIEDQYFLEREIRILKKMQTEHGECRYLLQVSQEANVKFRNKIERLTRQRWWFFGGGFFLALLLLLLSLAL